MDAATLWAAIERGGVMGLLVLNIVVLWKLGVLGLKQITAGEWVPGKYYKDVVADRDRLRDENNAYRSVTLRAVGVVERVAKASGDT